VNQELLLQNEYLAAENRILRAKLPSRLRLSAYASSRTLFLFLMPTAYLTLRRAVLVFVTIRGVGALHAPRAELVRSPL
jgi:hypothetical protein